MTIINVYGKYHSHTQEHYLIGLDEESSDIISKIPLGIYEHAPSEKEFRAHVKPRGVGKQLGDGLIQNEYSGFSTFDLKSENTQPNHSMGPTGFERTYILHEDTLGKITEELYKSLTKQDFWKRAKPL